MNGYDPQPHYCPGLQRMVFVNGPPMMSTPGLGLHLFAMDGDAICEIKSNAMSNAHEEDALAAFSRAEPCVSIRVSRYCGLVW